MFSKKRRIYFGRKYVVLNLDLMNILIDSIRPSTEGQKFISNCTRWNDTIHKIEIRPVTIFTSLHFENKEQELPKESPFAKLLDGFGSLRTSSSEVQISPEFVHDEKDIILQKKRWYAGYGNELQHILVEEDIDTVIISGLSLSGVVLSTIYHLFDLDYQIFVIRDNVLELPPSQTPEFARIMLDALLPKMGLMAISLEEALEAIS